MLKEKNLGTIFYVRYDPSLLKKRKIYVITCSDIKARGSTTHCYQWWDSRWLVFFLKLVWVFPIFYNKPVWFWLFFFPPDHKCCKNVSPHSAWHQKRPLLFKICRQKKKKVYVRVQFANYHNVQMGFEFSGRARLLVPAPAYELQHGPSAA